MEVGRIWYRSTLEQFSRVSAYFSGSLPGSEVVENRAQQLNIWKGPWIGEGSYKLLYKRSEMERKQIWSTSLNLSTFLENEADQQLKIIFHQYQFSSDKAVLSTIQEIQEQERNIFAILNSINSQLYSHEKASELDYNFVQQVPIIEGGTIQPSVELTLKIIC